MFGQQFAATPQLLANPTQITQPWLNLNLNMQPPYVPRVSMDPQLQQIAPLVSISAAMEIQSRAQQGAGNALRIHMFNLYSQNNFANEHFEALVAAIVDFIWVEMMKRTYMNLEQAVQDGVPKMVEMLTAMQLVQFPALEQYTDPNLQHGARQLIAVFNQVAGEIKAAKARMGNTPATAGGWGGAPQQGGWGGQGGYVQQPSFQPNQGRTWGAAAHTWSAPTAAPALTGGSTSLFAGRQGGTASSGGTTSPSASRYDDRVLRQPIEPLKEEPVQQAATPVAAPVETPVVAAAPVEELVPAARVKWRPSPNYPYIPAYNPLEVELFFKTEQDGTLKPVLKQRSEKLDYERHAVSSTFGPRPMRLDTSKTAETLERVQKGIEQINQTNEVVVGSEEEPAAELPFTQLTRRDVLLDTSETAVWIAGGLERLAVRVDDQIPDIYRLWAKIAEPVVGLNDETPFVRSFASAASFLELREKLNASVNKISASLWGAVDTRMTKAINRVVKQNLSIPGLDIDSFTADIEDLIKVLENKYGDLVVKAFLKHEGEVIRQVLGCLAEEEAEGLTQVLFDAGDYPEDAQPQITYLASNVSFTFLNCRSHELHIELAKKTSSAVIRSITPMMHELLRGLFEAADKVSEELVKNDLPGEFARHLIRTTDGRVLEAQRGYLSEDFYVLTLVE